ncbi:MAG TPA: GNAT family N-acetyltransferase [Candidatus Dormibacteraeota bacterium]|nr:GNAT family N-acetyltransferase [Candidatus Dormibacteraeota bacterium]
MEVARVDAARVRSDRAEFLAAFDAQLRGPVSIRPPVGAHEEADGPVHRAWGWSPRGLVTPGDLSQLDGSQLDQLIERQIAFFAAHSLAFEWKTYAHDRTAGIIQRLLRAGFVPEARETVVIGRARDLSRAPTLPSGVTLREVTSLTDADRMAELLTRVEGDDVSYLGPMFARERAADPHGVVLLVAEAEGQVVSTARLNLVPGTEFATLWSGSTHPQWRRQGLYRATVAYRARVAAARGFKYLQVDASENSRPILERLGFLSVSSTTPFVWSPGPGPQIANAWSDPVSRRGSERAGD